MPKAPKIEKFEESGIRFQEAGFKDENQAIKPDA